MPTQPPAPSPYYVKIQHRLSMIRYNHDLNNLSKRQQAGWFHEYCDDVVLKGLAYELSTVARISIKQLQKQKSPFHKGLRCTKPGGVLLSHPVSGAVPSVLEGLTSVFGMGTGVTPPLKSPGFIISWSIHPEVLSHN
jgi:hypothetical protein